MESEMDNGAEISSIEAVAEDLVRSGVPRPETLRRARMDFGGYRASQGGSAATHAA